MQAKQLRHEFRLSIDGITLDQPALDRVTVALQRAFLAELISLNLHGDEIVYTPVMSKLIAGDAQLAEGGGDGGGGSTGGASAAVRHAARRR